MCGSRGHNRALNATAAHDSIYRRVTAFGSDPFSHRSRRGTAYGLLAQRLAQGTHNPWVLGSNPGGPTMNLRSGRVPGLFGLRVEFSFVSTGVDRRLVTAGAFSATLSGLFKLPLALRLASMLVFSLLKSTGDWLRGRAYPSHGWGHKFESCIAHHQTFKAPGNWSLFAITRMCKVRLT